MANSGTVTAGSAALASQYNNLRDDVLNVSTGHTHTGASENGAKVEGTALKATGVTDGYVLHADGSGGVAWEALAAAGADVQEFTSSGSWVKPAGKSAVYVFALGGGGGGASGGVQVSGTDVAGGGGGGGASPVWRWMDASTLAGTVTVTIGAGGAGGSAVSAAVETAPNQGNFGGDTSFGTAIVAPGGAKGNNDRQNFGYYFGQGIVEWGYPLSTNGGSATAPGRTSDAPVLTTRIGTLSAEYFAAGAGAGESHRAAVRALSRAGGGGGGGGMNNNATGFFPGGAGARGFGHQLCAPAAGGTAAATAVAGENGGAFGLGNGGAGGGPGNAANITGGAGGNGYRGGGGGGGASTFRSSGTQTSGAGGAGGGGYMLVISV